MGARERGAAMPGAAAAMADGPGGPVAGPERVGSGHRLGPIRKGSFLFFSNLFLMRKQIPEKSRNCLKARKILRKSEKFQENS
jgi:hypothetical protein